MTNFKSNYSVWNIVCNREELRRLKENISMFPEIIQLLKYKNNITLFAPNNEAFKNFDMSCFTKEDILDLLKYHIVNETIFSKDIINDKKVNTISCNFVDKCYNKIRFNKYEDVYCNSRIMVDGKNIVQSDRQGKNGIIHIIDGVLKPNKKTIGEIIFETNSLSYFNNLISNANPSLMIAFNNPCKNLTIFAPTNCAFENYLSDCNLKKEDLLGDKKFLNYLLSYHIINNTIWKNSFHKAKVYAHNEEILTLENKKFCCDKTIMNIRDATNCNSQVIVPDFGNVNGVIHVIDRVLIPNIYKTHKNIDRYRYIVR